MRLRPYIECKDYDEIKDWITEERTHAMWCANLIKFPIEKGDFERVMKEAAERFGDSPYVATSDDGELIGFFCYSTNLETNEGMLKFVMTNPKYRGKGFGKEMLKLAVLYAFDITKVEAVHLNVFPENIKAKIVEGRVNKLMSQKCLLEQPFVKNPDQTVEALLNGKLEIKSFVRWTLGEGLEKRQDNFAEEVMSQMAK